MSKYLNFMNSKDGVRQIFTREKADFGKSKRSETRPSSQNHAFANCR